MAKIQDLRSITPRSNPTRSESQIKNIARHHSATTTGDWYTFWPYWNKTRGWGTGGYHEIILRDGTVQLCYDPHEITNGVANHNHAIYNICIVGSGSFTAAQEKAWNERCLIALKRFNLPISAVKGHNEFSGTNTSCPGINMNTVRQALSNADVSAAPSTVESIVDYLNAKGQDSSFPARAKLAAAYGIPNYRGTAVQNTQLLELIKSDKAKPKPVVVKPATPEKEEVKVVEKKSNEPSAWAKEDWEEMQANGYLDGTRPHDPMTRQEYAVANNRLRKNLLELINDEDARKERLEKLKK